MISYRFATDDDRESIYDFALQAIQYSDIPEFAEDAGQNLQERISEGDPENVIVAIDSDQEEKIVGYIEVEPHQTHMLIRGIYVLPEYRRQGIGQKLLKMMQENKCKNNEQIRVHAFTEAGKRFWEEIGFKIHHYALYFDS